MATRTTWTTCYSLPSKAKPERKPKTNYITVSLSTRGVATWPISPVITTSLRSRSLKSWSTIRTTLVKYTVLRRTFFWDSFFWIWRYLLIFILKKFYILKKLISTWRWPIELSGSTLLSLPSSITRLLSSLDTSTADFLLSTSIMLMLLMWPLV